MLIRELLCQGRKTIEDDQRQCVPVNISTTENVALAEVSLNTRRLKQKERQQKQGQQQNGGE